MNILENKKDCCGCHACYNACPVNAIVMKSDEEGFIYPWVQNDICIHCDKCKKVCPAVNPPEDNPFEIAYGCYSKNMDELMHSSSGGLFSVLSRYILSEGGIVCGAAFDEEQMVFHFVAENEMGLQKLKETKYVQSRIGNAYQHIDKVLKENKKVLFSGTPCQIAGLNSFLGKGYEQLYCIDLICHGVPSPTVWKKYLEEIAQNRKIEHVTFRNKKQGMSHITLDYQFEDGTIYQEKYADSLYMKGFIQNLYIRPSCFHCKFKGIQRCSDITMGDFWAMKEFHPLEYHEKGISAVIIHSEKGKTLFDSVKQQLVVVPATSEEIVCWNESLIVSAKNNPNRGKFFKSWNDYPIMQLILELDISDLQKKAKKKSLMLRILKKIWRLRKERKRKEGNG